MPGLRYQEALRLRKEGLSYKEIAARMGVSIGGVGNMLRVARQRESQEEREKTWVWIECRRLQKENAELLELVRKQAIELHHLCENQKKAPS